MAWLRQFIIKVSSLINWVSLSQNSSLLSKNLKLSDLLRPGTFLNALRQKSASNLKCSIDELKLVSSFEPGKLGNNAIQLDGLVLQGCGFDGGRLAENSKLGDRSSEFVTLPIC